MRTVAQLLDDHVRDGTVPGAVAAVGGDGELAVEVAGNLALEADAPPVQRDSIFRISSMTKPVTAAATLTLVDDGTITLDQPVDDVLPELARRRVLRAIDGPLDDTVPAARAITVRDVLSFTFGMGLVMTAEPLPIVEALASRELGQGPPAPQLPPAPDEFMRRLGELPLLTQPGTQWHYNTGSDVLGVLVARAAGKPFDHVLRERIFEPLGMRDTAFAVPAAQRHRFATAYAWSPVDGALRVTDTPDGDWSTRPAFPGGGAGLVSTVDDYVAFARMLLGRGALDGERILSPESVAAMTSDQLSPETRAASSFPGMFDAQSWGFGVAVVTRQTAPHERVGSYGWDGGLGSVWRNDPSRQRVVVLLTQAAFTSPSLPTICREVLTAALAT